MKKIVISLIVVLTTLTACAQNQSNSNSPTSLPKTENVAVYQLFPTTNMWTFIKLNTRNGQMWQIQYDVQGDNRGEVSLSSISLVLKTDEINGRFTLYPTQNMWTFILLDQIGGQMWQVQWSTDATKRGIIPIQ
jgi:hypothetical protein